MFLGIYVSKQRVNGPSGLLLAANASFYPRDAMLARVLTMALCLSVRARVCHKSVFYRNGSKNRAGFGRGVSFDLFCTVF